jgi:hypothetical protein
LLVDISKPGSGTTDYGTVLGVCFIASLFRHQLQALTKN